MTVWLQDAFGLDPLLARGLQLVIAFLFVVAAIFLVFALLKRRARGRLGAPRAPQRRLGLVEAVSVDDTRRLVLVRRDQVEHLLLIGGPADLVVESGITRAAAKAQAGPGRSPVAGAPPVAPEPPPPAAAPDPMPEPAAVRPPPVASSPPSPPPVTEPAPLRVAPERPAPPRAAAEPPPEDPRPRPAAALDLRPVRPTAPTVEPAAAPRSPGREAPLPRIDPDPPARPPSDGIIRPERR